MHNRQAPLLKQRLSLLRAHPPQDNRGPDQKPENNAEQERRQVRRWFLPLFFFPARRDFACLKIVTAGAIISPIVAPCGLVSGKCTHQIFLISLAGGWLNWLHLAAPSN